MHFSTYYAICKKSKNRDSCETCTKKDESCKYSDTEGIIECPACGQQHKYKDFKKVTSSGKLGTYYICKCGVKIE